MWPLALLALQVLHIENDPSRKQLSPTRDAQNAKETVHGNTSIWSLLRTRLCYHMYLFSYKAWSWQKGCFSISAFSRRVGKLTVHSYSEKLHKQLQTRLHVDPRTLNHPPPRGLPQPAMEHPSNRRPNFWSARKSFIYIRSLEQHSRWKDIPCFDRPTACSWSQSKFGWPGFAFSWSKLPLFNPNRILRSRYPRSTHPRAFPT